MAAEVISIDHPAHKDNWEPFYTEAVIEELKSKLGEGTTVGGKVAIAEAVETILVKHRIAWHQRVPPDMAGIHPANRSKYGLGAHEVHQHGENILSVGFSFKKASDVVAFEMAPDPWGADAIASNERIVQLSEGKLPPLCTPRIMSIGGGTQIRSSGQSGTSAQQMWKASRTKTSVWTRSRCRSIARRLETHLSMA